MWPFRRDPAVVVPPPPTARQALSLLPPDTVRELGRLPAEAVIGVLSGAGEAALFEPNPAFTVLLHDVIRATLPLDPGWRRSAAEQGEGWLYVIDGRTPDGAQGRVPFADIIGGFELTAGQMDPGRYWANPGHVAWTRDGMSRLPAELLAPLLRGIVERARNGG